MVGPGGVHRCRSGGVAGGGHDRAARLPVRAVGAALAGAHRRCKAGAGAGIGSGYEAGGRPGRRVLVVDAADHLSPTTLASLLDRAASSRTKVVLVLGGTVPGNGPSVARSLDHLAESRPARRRGLLAPRRLGRWPRTSEANGAVSLPGIVVRGSLTGADAMAHAVEAWAAEAHAGHDRPPLMVAFGPAEAEALNLGARPLWLELQAAGAHMAGAHMAGEHMAGTHMAGTQVAGAHMAGAHMAGTQVAGAHMARAQVTPTPEAPEFPAVAEVCSVSALTPSATGWWPFDASARPRARPLGSVVALGAVRSPSSGKARRARGGARSAPSMPVRSATATPPPSPT